MLLGPAFAAAMAYVDPGNVAANLTAGMEYGFMLVWVLVLANAMAMLIQYQSAKIGIVTGHTLSALVGNKILNNRLLVAHQFGRQARFLYWVQAQTVAIATDIAEVVGGALGLHLLFGIPLWLGGVIVGVASLAILRVQSWHGEIAFELVVSGLLLVITFGFLAGLFFDPPPVNEALAGLIPRLDGTESLLLASAMLGATVMPHAIYVHSLMARDRHRPDGRLLQPVPTLLHATKWDVVLALAMAGAVNIGMLLLAANTLGGVPGNDAIHTAHAVVGEQLGTAFAVMLAVGLLASGLGSTAVGAHAGATILDDLTGWRFRLLPRRLITLVPSVGLLATGLNPTMILVVSQAVLSVGIPFALVPLVMLTGDRAVMGAHVNPRLVQWVLWGFALAVVVLNVALLCLTLV